MRGKEIKTFHLLLQSADVQRLGPGKLESRRSRELLPVFPCGKQGVSIWATFCCLVGDSEREREWIWGAVHSILCLMGCQDCLRWFYSLSYKAGPLLLALFCFLFLNIVLIWNQGCGLQRGCLLWAPVHVTAALLSIHFSASGLGKAAEVSSRSWAPATHERGLEEAPSSCP